jgi:putative membrane protein
MMVGMDWYLFMKACHIVAVVCWFAGLFYLPRLMVYDVEAPGARPVLRVMQRRLLVLIMRPAAAATWALGMALLLMNPDWMTQGWMHAKLLLVLLLTAYHGTLEMLVAQLARGACTKSARFFRLYNEVPTVLLIVVVMLVVMKPF